MSSDTEPEKNYYELGVGTTLFEGAAGILLFIVALIIVLICANLLIGEKWNENHELHIPESGVSMFIGICIGGLLKIGATAGDDPSVERNLIVFSPALFFLGLLPPIIFNEGHHLDKLLFFAHLTPIIIFAFIGTAVAAVVTAFMVHYGAEMTGVEEGIGMPEAATFGSLISATDPVAVLAAFSSLRVEPTLFFIVFGESVLNDAVSLTMFAIASKFVGSDQGPEAIGIGIMDFFIIMVGSAMIGWLLGLAMALALKTTNLRQARVLELALYSTLVYLPYMAAQVLGMSGIVAILVAGITARHYAYKNLSSDDNRDLADFIFRLLSFIADNAVFLYLGMAIFGIPAIGHSFKGLFVLWAFFACLVSRAVAVFGLCAAINVSAPCTGMESIGWRTQVVMWFSGLRGAVAFAAVTVFPDEEGHRNLMQTTTMAIIIIFTFIVAPWTVPLLRRLKIPMHVDYRTVVIPQLNQLYKWISEKDQKWIQPRLLRITREESELTGTAADIMPTRPPRQSRQVPVDVAMAAIRAAMEPTGSDGGYRSGPSSHHVSTDLDATIRPVVGRAMAARGAAVAAGSGDEKEAIETPPDGPGTPRSAVFPAEGGSVERWLQDSLYDFGRPVSPRQPAPSEFSEHSVRRNHDSFQSLASQNT